MGVAATLPELSEWTLQTDSDMNYSLRIEYKACMDPRDSPENLKCKLVITVYIVVEFLLATK